MKENILEVHNKSLNGIEFKISEEKNLFQILINYINLFHILKIISLFMKNIYTI
jgi:hypothetical protein